MRSAVRLSAQKLNPSQNSQSDAVLDEEKYAMDRAKTFDVYIATSGGCRQPVLKPVFCSIAPQTPPWLL